MPSIIPAMQSVEALRATNGNQMRYQSQFPNATPAMQKKTRRPRQPTGTSASSEPTQYEIPCFPYKNIVRGIKTNFPPNMQNRAGCRQVPGLVCERWSVIKDMCERLCVNKDVGEKYI